MSEMKMGIYIPSRSRWDKIAEKSTLAKIPVSLAKMVRVVVPQDQIMEYEEATRQYHGDGIEIVGTMADGIARTRHVIGGMAKSRGEELFVMLDDDLQFFTRNPNNLKLTKNFPGDTVEMFRAIYRKIAYDDYHAVGVSPREGNNRVEQPEVDNTRLMRVLAFNTKSFLGCEHNRVQVMEDFDILLQLLRQGKKNMSFYNWSQDQGKTQAPGGCSDYRTHEVHEASAEKLAALHEGFVTLRTKQNKTDRDGFGTRKEVTIQWKKAFASSQIG